jgi:hypothetical protein
MEQRVREEQKSWLELKWDRNENVYEKCEHCDNSSEDRRSISLSHRMMMSQRPKVSSLSSDAKVIKESGIRFKPYSREKWKLWDGYIFWRKREWRRFDISVFFVLLCFKVNHNYISNGILPTLIVYHYENSSYFLVYIAIIILILCHIFFHVSLARHVDVALINLSPKLAHTKQFICTWTNYCICFCSNPKKS